MSFLGFAADTVRSDLMSYYSDAHKDAYGFRPRYAYDGQAEMPLSELFDECDAIERAVIRSIEEDRVRALRDRLQRKLDKSAERAARQAAFAPLPGVSLRELVNFS